MREGEREKGESAGNWVEGVLVCQTEAVGNPTPYLSTTAPQKWLDGESWGKSIGLHSQPTHHVLQPSLVYTTEM